MADWNTRLAVSFVKEDKTTVLITPIDQFSPTFTLGAEALHSIERTHIGVIYATKQLTFTMTVRAIGGVVGQLTELALNRKLFDIVLQEQDGADWSFKSIVMRRCIINSAQPGAVTPTGAPTATFSGFSLEATSSPKVGEDVTVP